MRHCFSPRHSVLSFDLPPLVRLWILRIVVALGGHRTLVQDEGFADDALAEAVGLAEWIDVDSFDPRAIRRELRKLHRDAEGRSTRAATPACLRGNVARLAELIGLSQTDRRILEFAVLLHSERMLNEAADLLGGLSSTKVIDALAVILNLPNHDVRVSLSRDGLLGRSGLVTIEGGGASVLLNKLDLLSQTFAEHVTTTDGDPVRLLRDVVMSAAPAQLTLADFDHVGPALAILRPYLKHAYESGRSGVNIIVYGAAGTGKNEMSRAVAAELGCELFEVAAEDSDGDPIKGERRLRAFRAAQSFFGQRRALIVFDEVEDVFNDGDGVFGRKSTAQTCKAWINRMLESNPVPTVWLSNSIDCLDPAFIRRFDMVIELSVPPRKQRERIIAAAGADLLDRSSVGWLAECESLTPAVIARSAAVVRSIHSELGSDDVAAAIELLVGNTLEAQGYPRIRRGDPTGLPETYDPSLVNADADLASMVVGLERTRRGRLCLYGPPGTGKTAYARWLAQSLGLPLLVKRASDLLSMWVGGTEKNIARVFRVAGQDGAVLLIDEVDSFLQDRRDAIRSWEVTLVNELLTQMESFAGVFVASTNLMDNLDQGALRRFDIKVKFGYLRSAQAWHLLCRHLARLALPPPSSALESAIACLHTLTPGDFATAVRRHAIRPFGGAAEFVAALEAECSIKEGTTAKIGFC